MRIALALVASLLLLALSSSSVFATDVEQFWNKVKKSAPANVDMTPPVVFE